MIISAGFAEVGSSGREAEQAIVATARRNGMRVIGPNCLGIVNTAPDVQMNATFAPVVPVRGPVAFLSQSGGLGIELMSRTGELGIGISEFVSVGNKADVSGNDLLQHWETDPNTEVILFYLESFGNPRKFARLARRIARRKPIVAVKSGRTQAGSRAASSHTAALASPDVAVDALFRQAGVIRVDTLEQLLDTAQVLAHQPLPPGRRVAIIGNAGGPGILAADACAGAGLDVPELTAETQAALRAFVAADASVRNPIDLVASATAEQYERALRVVLADPEVDAVLAMFVPPLVTEAGGRGARDRARRRRRGRQAGRRVLPRPGRRARRAPRRVGLAARSRRSRSPRPPRTRSPGPPISPTGAAGPPARVPGFHDIDEAAARRLVDEHLLGHRGEGPAVPTACGWTPPRRRRCSAASASRCSRLGSCTSADEAAAAATELGYPVALKAGAPELVHKTDVGGVALRLPDAAAVRAAYAAMADRLGADMGGGVVQRMAAPGVETIVGVTQDPSFGPLVLFGYGGVAAELLADRTLRLVPMTDVDAAEVVRSLRSSPLLFGYRGQPAVDVAALEDLLLRVATLADVVPEVSEMDLNPVIVSEHGAVAVDVKVRIQPAPAPLPADFRRLRV